MRRMMLVVLNVVVISLLLTTSVLAAPAPVPAPAPTAWRAATYHYVRAGETLFSIGRRYNISPWAIASANHLPNWNRIYVGQCLYIPASTAYNTYYRNYYGCPYTRCYNCCGYRGY